MNPNTQLTDDTIDLRELFFSLLIQWKLIVFCTVFALVCAVAYLKVAKKTYSVDAKIQIIDNKQNGLAGLNAQLVSLGSLAGINLGGMGGAQSIQTEIEILQSRSILTKAIQDLNLDVQIQPEQSLINKFLSADQFQINYQADEIQVKNHKTQFSIHQFNIPSQYLDQNLILTFHGQGFKLVSEKTGLEVFNVRLIKNRNLVLSKQHGQWRLVVNSHSTGNILFKNSLRLQQSRAYYSI